MTSVFRNLASEQKHKSSNMAMMVRCRTFFSNHQEFWLPSKFGSNRFLAVPKLALNEASTSLSKLSMARCSQPERLHGTSGHTAGASRKRTRSSSENDDKVRMGEKRSTIQRRDVGRQALHAAIHSTTKASSARVQHSEECEPSASVSALISASGPVSDTGEVQFRYDSRSDIVAFGVRQGNGEILCHIKADEEESEPYSMPRASDLCREDDCGNRGRNEDHDRGNMPGREQPGTVSLDA